MKIPEYITKAEVKRVCDELGFRDWSQLTESEVSEEEARTLQQIVGGEAEQVSTRIFKLGLEVELEHGTQFSDANLTNNHPILTAMIVLAHLKEMLDYYQRLEIAELEGDMQKAFLAGDREKLFLKYMSLQAARASFSSK